MKGRIQSPALGLDLRVEGSLLRFYPQGSIPPLPISSELREQIKELNRGLQLAWMKASTATKRAGEAEAQAKEAERRAKLAEERAQEEARKAELAEKRAREAEKLLADLSSKTDR